MTQKCDIVCYFTTFEKGAKLEETAFQEQRDLLLLEPPPPSITAQVTTKYLVRIQMSPL